MSRLVEIPLSMYRKFLDNEEPCIWHFIRTGFEEDIWIGVKETPHDPVEKTVQGTRSEIFNLTGVQL